MNTVKPFQAAGFEGLLHSPAEAIQAGLVLTHGAGANSQAALLVAVAEAFCEAGWHVLRYDLPFRQKRRFGPPHPSQAAEDRAGLRGAANALTGEIGGPVCLGGHSYGGRQASMLLAENPDVAVGLLLLSYPLHPPNQPAKLRTAHFPNLRTPTLFVHGTTDPFGSPEGLRKALETVPAPHSLSLVGGAGHDLRKGRFDIGQHVTAPFLALFAPPNRTIS